MKAKAILAALLTFLLSTICPAEDPPNIIFILADDLGYQDVGFNGSSWFETPRLDSLAAESVVFKNACMYPTCSPSRTALFTGKHSFRTQVYTVPVLEKGGPKENIFSRWTVEEKHPFYSQPLNQAGYQLIHLGKYHVVGPNPEKETKYPFKKKLTQPKNGTFDWVTKHKKEYQKYYPIAKGFHENVGGTFWGDPARGYPKGYNAEGGGYLAPYHNPFIESEPQAGTWLTDFLTDEAIRFMDTTKEGPFFINLNYYSPHRPSIPTSQESLKKYQAKATDPATGQSAKKAKEMAAYGSMVENLDANVGRLIDYLDKNKLRENTVIIFTSDNGYNSFQSFTKNLRGQKGNIYEGGIKVPALLNWKGKIEPSEKTENISVLDFFPTFLDLANHKDHTGQLDGTSFLPLARGEKLETPRTLFWYLASTYKNPPCVMLKEGRPQIHLLRQQRQTRTLPPQRRPHRKQQPGREETSDSRKI